VGVGLCSDQGVPRTMDSAGPYLRCWYSMMSYGGM